MKRRYIYAYIIYILGVNLIQILLPDESLIKLIEIKTHLTLVHHMNLEEYYK